MESDAAVDFSRLEAVKENVRQRRGGHSAKALSTPSSTRATEAERMQLEAAVALCAGSTDPLDAHVQLLAWYSRTYAGDPPKQYFKVLENAARLFRKDARYANDVRFVSIWIQVAKRAPEPEDVFKYLESNSIGILTSIFYTEYATLLELRGRNKDADAVFALGIARKASPLDSLQRKHVAFQQRMMVARTSSTSAEDDEVVREPSPPPVVRHVLASARTSHHRPASVATASVAASSGYSSYSSYGSSRPAVAAKNAPAAKITVFKDEATSSSAPAPSAAWHDYGTKASITKENSLQPEPWTGATVLQKAAIGHQAPLPGSKVKVFADEPEATVAKQTTSKSNSRVTILAPSQDPGASQRVSNLLKPENRTSPPPTLLPRRPPSPACATDRLQFDRTRVYVDGDEFSFEELRARDYWEAVRREEEKARIAAAVRVEEDRRVEELRRRDEQTREEEEQLLAELKREEDLHLEQRKFEELKFEQQRTEIQKRMDVQQSTEAEQRHENQGIPVSVDNVVMTQARAAITTAPMFQQPSQVQAGDGNPFSGDASDEEDDDVEVDVELERLTTHNTAGNTVYGDNAAVSVLVGFGSKAKAVASPTINTKAALEDVYGMFNAPVARAVPEMEHQTAFSSQMREGDMEEGVEGGDEEDEGDEVVAVKNGLNDHPEWYEIEADETISKNVFKPQVSSLKSAIFVDGSSTSEPNVPTKQTLTVFNDENAVPAPIMKKERKPLGTKDVSATLDKKAAPAPVVDVRSPFFHDETAASRQPPSTVNSPSLASTLRASESAAASGMSTSEYDVPTSQLNREDTRTTSQISRAMASAPNLQSTPHSLYHPHNRYLSLDDTVSLDTEDEEAIKNHEVHYYERQPHYTAGLAGAAGSFKNSMTPLHERSFEEEARFSLTGLSTISSVRYHVDDTLSSLGRPSGVGSLRESLTKMPMTALTKRRMKEMNEGLQGDEEDEEGEVEPTLSSISMVSSKDLSSHGHGSHSANVSHGANADGGWKQECEERDEVAAENVRIGKSWGSIAHVGAGDVPLADMSGVQVVDNNAVSSASVLSQMDSASSVLQTLTNLAGADVGLAPIASASPEQVTPTALDSVNLNESKEVPNPCDPHVLADVRKEEMMDSDTPITGMIGYIDCRKSLAPPKISSLLEEALAKSPNGGLCQIQFGATVYVRFGVLKRLSSSGDGATIGYVAKELKTGLLGKFITPQEEDELEDVDDDDTEEDEDDDDDQPKGPERRFLLQVETPADGWEFYALRLLRTRLPDRVLASVASPVSCHLFQESSCLRLEYVSDKTLKDAIGMSIKCGYGTGFGGEGKDGGVDELLAAFWTIELLRTLEAIHSCGFLHGNVSPETLLVRLGHGVTLTGASGFWDAKYDAGGLGGWGVKGLLMTGFREAIELFEMPDDNQRFVGVSCVSKCWEVQNARSTRYEPDWYGAANSIHWMLFGKDLQVSLTPGSARDERPLMMVSSTLKKSWQTALWARVFDAILNLENADVDLQVNSKHPSILRDEDFAEFVEEFPPALQIRVVRLELEEWLTGSCCKGGKSLKSLLQRVEMGCL
ncbi:hypothetical protein BC830DRAFT_1171405 [Chytriomyces sp. MP71]|nr:hypothetical protein BC830DRAFT_1171405 [Chytriomyces sp. MP71]